MRTSTLITSYIQATLFLALGIRCVTTWLRSHNKRSGHLAAATTLWGLNSLMSAISQTVWDTSLGEQAPRGYTIVTSIIIYLAVYAFLVFLADFIQFPAAMRALVIVATLFNIVMAIIERPGIAFRQGRIVTLNVKNPIPYRGYLWYVIIYLTVVFAVLGFSFLLYGVRLRGVARLRMTLIGSGFTILFVAIGLIPLLLFGNPTATTIQNLLNVIRYLALVSAPLLFLGFSPPKGLIRRFAGSEQVATG